MTACRAPAPCEGPARRAAAARAGGPGGALRQPAATRAMPAPLPARCGLRQERAGRGSGFPAALLDARMHSSCHLEAACAESPGSRACQQPCAAALPALQLPCCGTVARMACGMTSSPARLCSVPCWGLWWPPGPADGLQSNASPALRLMRSRPAASGEGHLLSW